MPPRVPATLVLASALGCQAASEAPRPPTQAPLTAAPAPPADTGRCAAIPEEARALARALDDQPDPLHMDFTPAVHALIRLGLSGACAVIDELDAPDRLTRLHAQRVLEGVVTARDGFRAGRGYPDGYGQEHTTLVLKALGYDHDAGDAERRAAAARWKDWLAKEPEEPPAYTPPDGPSRREMLAALAPARGALERCFGNAGPIDAHVVFAPSGRVSSIWSEWLHGDAARKCFEEAVSRVSVPPFERASASVIYTPQSP